MTDLTLRVGHLLVSMPKFPSSFVIGSVCVGDNKPRSGIDAEALDKLSEVASAVAAHLDLVYAQYRLRRSQEMVQGLGQFVYVKVSVLKCCFFF